MIDDIFAEASAEKPKVLIVDDVPENVRILANALKGDYEMMVATDGETALELVYSERQPDLILLDVMMPGLDGYEVCRRLKDDPVTAEVPIIFITALGEDSDEARGFEVGGVDYVTKPINPLLVEARVHAHLELRRKTETIRREREELRVAHSRLAEAMKKLQDDIDLAAQIQSGLLPPGGEVSAEGGLTLVTRYQPEMNVGGDFFDYRKVGENSTAVILADVSGHGLQAAFVTGLIKSSFELAGKACADPAEFATGLNNMLTELTPSGTFATMIYFVYDGANRILHYLNAGHLPFPILIEPGRRARPLSEDSSMVLAVARDNPTVEQFEITPGSKLLLSTDGMVDALNTRGEQFSYARLLKSAERHSDLAAKDFDDAVFSELSSFTSGADQFDDIAMLTAQFS